MNKELFFSPLPHYQLHFLETEGPAWVSFPSPPCAYGVNPPLLLHWFVLNRREVHFSPQHTNSGPQTHLNSSDVTMLFHHDPSARFSDGMNNTSLTRNPVNKTQISLCTFVATGEASKGCCNIAVAFKNFQPSLQI